MAATGALILSGHAKHHIVRTLLQLQTSLQTNTHSAYGGKHGRPQIFKFLLKYFLQCNWNKNVVPQTIKQHNCFLWHIVQIYSSVQWSMFILTVSRETTSLTYFMYHSVTCVKCVIRHYWSSKLLRTHLFACFYLQKVKKKKSTVGINTAPVALRWAEESS